jgi:ribose-phosphate pyrophosphokinase
MINSKDVKIFCGNSNHELAEKIAKYCGAELGAVAVMKFEDGEINIRIDETVRGRDVFLIQSTSNPVNENLMEVLIFIDALRRASAKSITVVMPYYGYARQDRKANPREPITSKLVANLLTKAGATRVMTMDLHADQIQGFFDIPVDHLQALPLLAKYFIDKGLHGEKVVVVSPDIGGVKRARKLAEWLDCKIVIIDKRRPKPNMSEVMNVIGEVEGKIAIFIDDMIDTAGTIIGGADSIIARGAIEAYACCSHGIFSGPAIERIKNSALKEVVITDSIQQNEDKRLDKIKILTSSEIFAEAISRVVRNEALSELFEKKIM